jgi:hypothetical protein
MNPFGSRPAHVRGARVAAKTRRFPYPGAAIRRHRPISTHDCEDSFGYAKFTPIAPAIARVQCNIMNFFSSSRKVFAPV